MRPTLALLRFCAFCLSAMSALPCHAESGESLTEKRDALVWFKKMQAAAQKFNYSGIFVYQQAQRSRSSRITHLNDGKNDIEKLEVLDGKPGETIRRNEEISRYLPESKKLMIEKRVTQDVFPGILANNRTDLMDHYQLRKGELDRVAGFACQTLYLEPRDHERYGYRLCAEKSTGLLLRAQTLNQRNEIIEQIGFTQLIIDDIGPDSVKSRFSNIKGWRVETAIIKDIGPTGWIAKWLPPGFIKTHEIKRQVSNGEAGANSQTPSQRQLTQIVFSDGLAAISIFIEPGTQSRTEGSVQNGAISILGKRQGDYWLTIVGEAPPAAIRRVANSIEYQPQ